MNHSIETLLCFTGLPASGKSTACNIASAEGVKTVSMGDIVRERARDALGDDATSEEIGEWATEHREKYGVTVFAEHTSEAIQQFGYRTVAVDGVRSPAELDVFENTFDSVEVVYVETPLPDRLERLRNRGRNNEVEFTEEDLKARDNRELDWGLEDLKSQERYDTVIKNTGSYDEFESRICEIISSVTDNTEVAG